jgi:riboflavin kinase/FMN adenylyltransferase
LPRILHSLNEFPDALRSGAVTIGNFDGVHLGHARLVERLRAMAGRVAGPAVAFTFDPPPARILRPDAAPEPLMPADRRVEILGQLGVDAILVYPTDLPLLKLEAREFFDQIVRGRLGCRAMVEGPNFFFGHNRSGNVEVLRGFCAEAGMPLEVVEPVEIGGQAVSSSRIRSLVLEGRLDEARQMLGRPYRLRGLVIDGAGRGAGLGYPTANLGQIDTLVPGEGIYAARASAEGRWYPAAVNIGPSPTFNDPASKVEAFLIGFQGALRRQTVEVDFLSRLRDIQRFASADALVAQMAMDVARTVALARD